MRALLSCGLHISSSAKAQLACRLLQTSDKNSRSSSQTFSNISGSFDRHFDDGDWVECGTTELLALDSHHLNFCTSIPIHPDFDMRCLLVTSSNVVVASVECTMRQLYERIQSPSRKQSQPKNGGVVTIQLFATEQNVFDVSPGNILADLTISLHAIDVTMFSFQGPYHARHFFTVPTQSHHTLHVQNDLIPSDLSFVTARAFLAFLQSDTLSILNALDQLSLTDDECIYQYTIDRVRSYYMALYTKYDGYLKELQKVTDNLKKSTDKLHDNLSWVATNCCIERMVVKMEECQHDDVEFFWTTMGAPTAHHLGYKHYDQHLIEPDADIWTTSFHQSATARAFSQLQTDLEGISSSLASHISNLQDALSSLAEPHHQTKSSNRYANAVESALQRLTLFVCESCRTCRDALGSMHSITNRTHKGKEKEKNETLNRIANLQQAIHALDRSILEKYLPSLSQSVLSVLAFFKSSTDSNLGSLFEKVGTALAYVAHNLTRLSRRTLATVAIGRCLVDPSLHSSSSSISPTKSKMMPQIRLEPSISQALGGIVTALDTLFSKNGAQSFFWKSVSDIGILVHFESLLSVQGDERGMVLDTIRSLRVLERIVSIRVHAYEPTVTKKIGDHPTEVRQRIEISGDRTSMIVSLGVPEATFKQYKKAKCGDLKLTIVMFTQGINEQQVVANFTGNSKIQKLINIASLERLERYLQRWKLFWSRQRQYGVCVPYETQHTMETLLADLRMCLVGDMITEPKCLYDSSSEMPHDQDTRRPFSLSSPTLPRRRTAGDDWVLVRPESVTHMPMPSKHKKTRLKHDTTVLHLSSHMCRLFSTTLVSTGDAIVPAPTSVKITTCKSAKDRTAMSVTLDQALLLRHLPSNVSPLSPFASLYVPSHPRSSSVTTTVSDTSYEQEIKVEMHEAVFSKTLECLRSEQGTRLRNVSWNLDTDDPKFAFNAMQLRVMPVLYRPPVRCTHGGIVT